MAIIKREHLSVQAILGTIIYLIPLAFSSDYIQIPPTPTEVETWFSQNVQPLAGRLTTLDPELATAENTKKIITVKSDGSGQFKTIADAINSIPPMNTNRVIISIGPGIYREKVSIERTKKFVTLYGDPVNRPTVIFNGSAKQFGTYYSGTFAVWSDYFSAVNINFKNDSPRPGMGAVLQQAVAFSIAGDKASFYKCNFYGFQDTLLDDTGRHFYKDCYIEGTVDFIFGNGRTLYLNCEIHVIPGDAEAVIAAQGGDSRLLSSGFSFVHCRVTGGTTPNGFLGRAWRKYPQVMFSYSFMSETVHPGGWSDCLNTANDETVFFAEYKNTGPGANMATRVKYVRQLTDLQAAPFLSLSFIMASKWLLPPAAV